MCLSHFLGAIKRNVSRKTCGIKMALQHNLGIKSSLNWLACWVCRLLTVYSTRYKNPVKPGALFWQITRQIPQHLAANHGFDYSLRQMNFEGQYGKSGRISKPRARPPPHQSLDIQELLAPISIGQKPFFVPGNDEFQVLKASQLAF